MQSLGNGKSFGVFKRVKETSDLKFKDHCSCYVSNGCWERTVKTGHEIGSYFNSKDMMWLGLR